jgi:vacuolar-type H+-ATPase subunit H
LSADGPASRREIEDSTAARLAEIVAAAERAAKQVIDEAEAEARARLSDAHEEADRIVAERLAGLAAITDEIEAQAEALRRGAEALQAALARARAEFGGAESLGGSEMMGRREPDSDLEADGRRPTAPSLTVVGAPGPPLVPQPPATPEPPVAEQATAPGQAAAYERATAPDPAPEPEPEPISTPAGARLLATQMAVSGSSRDEIAARLRSGFEITDTASILDAILGPEL